MKKLALSLAVLFSVALVSCGGNKAEAADSETVAVEEVVAEEVVANDSETGVAVAVEAEAAPVESAAACASKLKRFMSDRRQMRLARHLFLSHNLFN